MNMLEVEAKWNKKWEEEKTYKFDPSRIDKKYYVLEMFSYPSGAKLHVGHWFNYGPSDSFARFKRMQGYSALWLPGVDHAGLRSVPADGIRRVRSACRKLRDKNGYSSQRQHHEKHRDDGKTA